MTIESDGLDVRMFGLESMQERDEEQVCAQQKVLEGLSQTRWVVG